MQVLRGPGLVTARGWVLFYVFAVVLWFHWILVAYKHALEANERWKAIAWRAVMAAAAIMLVWRSVLLWHAVRKVL